MHKVSSPRACAYLCILIRASRRRGLLCFRILLRATPKKDVTCRLSCKLPHRSFCVSQTTVLLFLTWSTKSCVFQNVQHLRITGLEGLVAQDSPGWSHGRRLRNPFVESREARAVAFGSTFQKKPQDTTFQCLFRASCAGI